jgi:large subunit ribosomal protein L15
LRAGRCRCRGVCLSAVSSPSTVSLKAISGKFTEGDDVNPETLAAKKLIKKADAKIKILAAEGLSFAVKISTHAISAKAREIVEGAGGTVTVIERK